MKTLFTICACLPALWGFAQDRVQPDRPDQSETPTVMPHRALQLETGIQFQKTEAYTTQKTLPVVLLRYGLLKNIELGLEAEHVRFKNSSSKVVKDGLAPTFLNTRIAFFKGTTWLPKLTLFAGTTLPMLSSKTIRPERAAPEVRLAFGNELTEDVEIEYNAGVEWSEESGRPTYVYSFTPGIAFLKNWSAFAEVYGETAPGTSAKTSTGAGLLYWPAANVVVDVHGGFALGTFKSTAYAGLGCSIKLH